VAILLKHLGLQTFARQNRMLIHLEQYIINEAEVINSEYYRTFLFISPTDGIISESERRFIGNSGDWHGETPCTQARPRGCS